MLQAQGSEWFWWEPRNPECCQDYKDKASLEISECPEVLPITFGKELDHTLSKPMEAGWV